MTSLLRKYIKILKKENKLNGKELIILMLLFFHLTSYADSPCIEQVMEKVTASFQHSSAKIEYTYCEYSKESSFFNGVQSITIGVDNQKYHYQNKVAGVGYFSGEMFVSQLGILGLVEATTGNKPLSISYLAISDNELILLGKVTFNQQMGRLVGLPYIENKNAKTDVLIKTLLKDNRQFIWSDNSFDLYEGLLFTLLSEKMKDYLTNSEFIVLSSKLSEYSDLVNFYRQKIFLNSSLFALITKM